MALQQFTNLNFEDIKTSLKDYLRENSNFSDMDFEGSNLSILINTLAYNSYITAYNTNMVVNETFIDSATLRENVVSLARNIGYVPRSKTAAKTQVDYFISGISTSASTKAPSFGYTQFTSGDCVSTIKGSESPISVISSESAIVIKNNIYKYFFKATDLKPS